jgi:hypothetical protein
MWILILQSKWWVTKLDNQNKIFFLYFILFTFKPFFQFYIYFTKNIMNPVYNEEFESYDLHTILFLDSSLNIKFRSF